ncbi:hypothetical protein ANCCAN_22382 [Ancylostoma caninum]|uniref:Uncharacterized protein n=1 Tax=Ancylostoma caninum TaxID=29170 RepID=A0A368FLD2_ANCCA|nr:hypothetical protein ANCCAN_22382 [Ancylostoma caninum]
MAMCNIFRLARPRKKQLGQPVVGKWTSCLALQVEQMQKDELDQVLQRLQLENMELKRELERRKAAVSTPDLDRLVSITSITSLGLIP